MKRFIFIVMVFLGLMSLLALSARAATIAVNTTAQKPGNTGDCTLGEAIDAANSDTAVDGCTAGSGADIITVPAGTYTLTAVDNTTQGDNGLPDITTEITISGTGASQTLITRSGTNIFRIFHVSSNSTLRLNGVMVSNGSATSSFIGGCILNYGTLTLTDSIVSGCTAASGGGIANSLGTVEVTRTIITGNTASTDTGGGIQSVGGSLTINESVISENQATNGNNGDGGGIYHSSGGVLNMYDSTVSGNTASDSGGGIYNEDATLNIYRSTLTQNTSGSGGGGIISLTSNAGSFSLVNSTVSGNTSSTSGGGIALLNTTQTTMNIINSTIVSNTANTGGGLAINGPVDIGNSIMANNTATSQGPDCAGTITTLNYTLIEDTGFCTLPAGTGNITDTDPALGPLQDNGGPTLTHALLAGSPAIDSADNQSAPATDQRGRARPQDGDGNGTAIADMGAYELEPAQAAVTAVPAINQWGILLLMGLLGAGGIGVLRRRSLMR